MFITIMRTEKQKTRHKEYMKEYNSRPEVKIRRNKYDREYNSRPEVKIKIKKYRRKYMKVYSKKPSEKVKKIIRMQSQRIYGKVPEGYERHHINYNSPHNFILIPIGFHKKIHEEYRTTFGHPFILKQEPKGHL